MDLPVYSLENTLHSCGGRAGEQHSGNSHRTNIHTVYAAGLDLNLRKKLVKCYSGSIALYGAETWTLRKVDQKYL
jgi:hypothetical protein